MYMALKRVYYVLLAKLLVPVGRPRQFTTRENVRCSHPDFDENRESRPVIVENSSIVFVVCTNDMRIYILYRCIIDIAPRAALPSRDWVLLLKYHEPCFITKTFGTPHSTGRS